MEHTHKKLDRELSDLRTRLSQMGGLVIEQMERALGCLSEHDFRGTRIIIERDTNVNRMDIDLEETCLQCMALHHPVAGDLRFITAVMKITTELERIGDRVVDVCDAVHNRDDRDSLEVAIVENLQRRAEVIGDSDLSLNVSYGGMSYEDVWEQAKLFADKVMPHVL